MKTVNIPDEVIKEWVVGQEGRKLVRVDINKPWAIEAMDGQTQFDILQKDLIEI